MKSVNIPDSIQYIDAGAFIECGLKEIILPGGVRTVEDSTFKDNVSLTRAVLADGVTQIKEKAFSGCTSLNEIELPSSITSIDDTAFKGCSNLTIVAPSGSKAENYAKEHNISFRAK